MTYQITPSGPLNEALTKNYKAFVQESVTDVSVLVNEYRRKKDAWESAEVKYRQEGEIDFSRICNYKTSNDIFNSQAMKRKGKSHGICILIDGSGSMRNQIHKVIRQAIIVAKFAQRVKIPYEMYYTGSRGDAYYDQQKTSLVDQMQNKLHISKTSVRLFASSEGTVVQQEKELFAAWVCSGGWNSSGITKQFSNYLPGYSWQAKPLPRATKLAELVSLHSLTGSTLLLEGILGLTHCVREFKTRKSLQNVTTLVLTDGGDTDGFSIDKAQDSSIKNIFGGTYRNNALDIRDPAVLQSQIFDENTRRTYELSELISKDVASRVLTSGYAAAVSFATGYFKALTGSKICAVHISDGAIRNGFGEFIGVNINSAMQSAPEFKRIVMAHFSENQNKYASFEGLMGYDFAAFLNTDMLKKKMTQEQLDAEVEKSRIKTKSSSNGQASRADIKRIFDTVNDGSKYSKILASDIASLICRDFEVVTIKRKAWFELLKKISLADPAVLKKIEEDIAREIAKEETELALGEEEFEEDLQDDVF